MPEYQVIARKYRPQTFREVVGQDAVVTTLKNAMIRNRLANAYLFCGSRGTGKTTLARVFAKALNCANPDQNHEPCGSCPSCKEIAAGISLDVLEIDGASHRGIEDIRQINETVGYASPSGKYKIYLIDEVHMLTKEAFNALLKTLEEPPAKVKFFFATTEPHKVLPTILSRCQRFNLQRIPTEKIIAKLQKIAQDLNVTIEDAALHLIANRADGGLRDAESLFDHIIAFHDNEITASSVTEVLGIMPRDVLFSLDKAGKEGRLSVAFDLAHQVFSQGKDLLHFVESITEHLRNLLLIKLNAPTNLPAHEINAYKESAQLYSADQLLFLIDMLVEAQTQIRFSPCPKIALEALLLKIMRSHQRIPVDFLVRKLNELEQSLKSTPIQRNEPKPLPPPIIESKPTSPPPTPPPSISIDPTPTPADLGLKEPTALISKKHDTLLQFAAVELEGTIHRKSKQR